MTAHREELFWLKVDKQGPVARPDLGNCWVWTASVNRNGYGQFWNGTRLEVAHRWLWQHENDIRLDRSADLDHLCRNHGCVRGSHLEPVTRVENIRRGLRGDLRPAVIPRPICGRGHDLTGDNGRQRERNGRSYIECRVCIKENTRAYRERLRESDRVHAAGLSGAA